MKRKTIIIIMQLLISLLTACGTPAITPTPNASPGASPGKSPGASPSDEDVKTTASIVNENEAFEKAIGTSGTWIICLLKDLTFDKELLLDGEYKNGKKDSDGKDIIQRKIALYTQDENRNVTARFTLTAPKLTINSPKARIQSGTFKGDLFVSAKDFELVDTTIEGNVYFTNAEAETTFKMDDKSKVTGKKELQK